jgi:hypothetical protein
VNKKLIEMNFWWIVNSYDELKKAFKETVQRTLNWVKSSADGQVLLQCLVDGFPFENLTGANPQNNV